MKNKIKSLIIGFLTLMSIEAHAQNKTPDLFTQVTMTQDYVNSMLDQLSNSSIDRMNLSKDYSEAGPELQNEIKNKLSQFRSAIQMIFSSAFTQMINEYNQTVQDKSLSPEKLAMRKSALYESITQLAKAVEASYQAQIKELFMIEKSIFIIYAKDKKSSWNYTQIHHLYYGDKTSEKVSLHRDTVIKYEVYTDRRLKKLLNNKCETQTCYSSLFNDYASFFSQVENFINKPVEIILVDGQKIVIEGFNDGTKNILLKTVKEFKFGNEYTTLPFSN